MLRSSVIVLHFWMESDIISVKKAASNPKEASMKNLFCSEFKRKFAISMYKNLKIKLGEMSFFKDFVNDSRGDPYPVMQKSPDCAESVENNRYVIRRGTVKRLFCQFFPFATYELSWHSTDGEAGFCFQLPNTEATVSARCGHVHFSCAEHSEVKDAPNLALSDITMIVSCRPGAFDVYWKTNGKPTYLCTFYEQAFEDSNRDTQFSNGYVSLFADGNVTVKEVLSYIDNGVSIADIRPIKYENGEPLFEMGKVYVTASVRMQEGTFQGVFSWIPGTAEFQMTGALFYDAGDGRWRGYVAPVILYHRSKKQWYVWVSSFAHEHILAHAAFDGDPRFGVNVVDVKIMEKASDVSDVTTFAGFRGDEDPDLFYDEENDRWLMAICRLNPKTGKYTYVFFESKDPFENYTYIGRGNDGEETGGSFVKVRGEFFFVCGNNFHATSEYRVYSKHGMQYAAFNHPDGGFRGWGTVIPITQGSRTRYFWLTFDRHNGSDYNWSYGNLYCFEA